MRAASRVLRRAISRVELHQLGRSNSPVARQVAGALRDDRATPDELAWFGRIEKERSRSTELARNPSVDKRLVAAALPPSWCRVLFRLARDLGPERVLELGTALGISGSYLAAALALNGRGELVTVDAGTAEVAREMFERLSLRNVRVIGAPFDEVLSELVAEKPELVFIDGNHWKEPTLRYHEQLAPVAKVIVYDDIRWSGEMRAAWAEIRRDERLVGSVDLGQLGVIVLG